MPETRRRQRPTAAESPRYDRPAHTRRMARVTALFVWFACACAGAEEIGKVDTKFNLLSPDDNITVASFEDPKIDGVVCYLSRAQKVDLGPVEPIRASAGR